MAIEFLEREFSTFLAKDLFHMCMGDEVGNGASRSVYVWRVDPSYVIKVDEGGDFDNVAEWEAWDAAKGTPAARWLAPVKFISPGGTFMLQKKTRPIEVHELPTHVPAWMTDFHEGNIGVLNGRPVFHDYANNKIAQFGMNTKRMVKAKWR